MIPLEVAPVITKFVDVFLEDQVDEEAYEGEDISHNCIRQTPSIHLPVVCDVFSQLKEKKDWRRNTIFHAFTKKGNQNCNMIVDRESCVNAVSSEMFRTDGLKSVAHSHLFKATALGVKQSCLVPVNFHLCFWRTL